MKIHYLSTSVVPSRNANSVHVMKMCQAFSRAGHDVTLFAQPGERSTGDDYNFYGVDDNFKIEKYSRASVRGWGPIQYALTLRARIKELGAPELLYGRDPYSLFTASDLGVPFALEVHAMPTGIRSAIEQRLFARPNFKGLVVISAALRDDYLHKFAILQPERVIVAPDGADVSAVPGSKKRLDGSRPSAFQVGYVGHLYPGRGIEIILRAAKALPDVDFHLIGGHESDITYWRRSANTDNILFHGYVQHGKLRSYYSAFDAVLAPYGVKVAVAGGAGDTSKWMSPMKIFEYMSHRLPIVCSRLPVLEEVLADGKTALLVAPTSVHEWVDAIKLLREDSALRSRLGSDAFDLLRLHYTWDRRACNVLSAVAPSNLN